MPYKDIEKRRESSRKNAKRLYIKNRPLLLERHKNWREKIKKSVIFYYSNGEMCCACCGEREYLFLTIDHINNDGTKERKLFTGGGHHNYRYIIKNGFPPKYQILCFNCNCGRARTKDKICPHKINEKK